MRLRGLFVARKRTLNKLITIKNAPILKDRGVIITQFLAYKWIQTKNRLIELYNLFVKANSYTSVRL